MLRDRAEHIVPFVIEFTEMHGYAPSIREIANACAFRSTSVVAWHLQRLRACGELTFEDHQNRTIRVPRRLVRVVAIEDVVTGRA